MSLKYYRVPCTTDAKSEFVWAETEPTVCPVNAGHSIVAGGIVIVKKRLPLGVIVDPSMEAIEPGASIVVANGRPAIEISTGQEGWGAIQCLWPHKLNSAAILRVCLKVILKATGTGTVARITARAKAQGAGDDSSEAWVDTQSLDLTVNHITIGEVFEGCLDLDASGFDPTKAVALQVGRAGDHANDTLDQSLQIIGVRAEAI
jgi:hypothetical protein